ncbi:hypothetical protein ENKO_477 [Klebsiella phage fENko-Kae01]
MKPARRQCGTINENVRHVTSLDRHMRVLTRLLREFIKGLVTPIINTFYRGLYRVRMSVVGLRPLHRTEIGRNRATRFRVIDNSLYSKADATSVKF